MKIDDLSGVALDWAVANAEGRAGKFSLANYFNVVLIGHQCFTRDDNGERVPYAPSEDWSIGGPIIEREMIEITPPISRNDPDQTWMATNIDSSGIGVLFVGPTPLIAAMRCYVASKLGANVDIPDYLL